MKPKPRTALYHLTVPVASSALANSWECVVRAGADSREDGTKASEVEKSAKAATADDRTRIVIGCCDDSYLLKAVRKNSMMSLREATEEMKK